jgi:hypothetical protein
MHLQRHRVLDRRDLVHR